MEFTYEGLVRYGFGFYNPNHAAALMCAMLPFVWLLLFSKPLWQKIVGATLTISLFVALALTYSRTGILIIALEATAFAFYLGRTHWKMLVAIGSILILSIFFADGFGRLTFDSSASNRLEIWQAGTKLFAANLFGVGLGNSGEIASAFFLPDDINCRTLVNSHLTLLCEFGFFAGVIWFSAIFYALANGLESAKKSSFKFAALVSFCGLLISASLSSVFDFEVLFRPSHFEHLSLLNVALEWANFGLFLILLGNLALGAFQRRIFVYSLILSCVPLSFALIFNNSQITIKVYDGETFIKTVTSPPYDVVLFDDNYTLKSALKILRKHKLNERIFICKNSWQNKEALPKENPRSFILFGNCAEFINGKGAPKILIMPPPHFKSDASNISKVYIPKWDTRYNSLKKNLRNVCIKDL